MLWAQHAQHYRQRGGERQDGGGEAYYNKEKYIIPEK
jgi:hypothetical protein